MQFARLLSLASLAVILAAGCSKANSPSPEPSQTQNNSNGQATKDNDSSQKPKPAASNDEPETNTVPAGWNEVRSRDITIFLPAEWKSIDLTSPKFDQELDALSAGNPKFKQVSESVRAMKGTDVVRFFAFDGQQVGSEFVNNLNLVMLPITDNASFDEVVKRNRETMAKMVTGSIDFRIVSLFGGRFGRMEYILSAGKENKKTMRSIAFITTSKNREVVFTFSASGNAPAEELRKLADTAMASAVLK